MLNPKILKTSEIKWLREKTLKEQNGICPLCLNKVVSPVLDHSHRRDGGDSLCRGVICNKCNILLGIIERGKVRYAIPDKILKAFFNSNIINYISNSRLPFIHPTEVKSKKKKLGKRNYNMVIKYWNKMFPRRKKPKKPKSGNITKEWQEYIDLAMKFKDKK